MHFKTRRRRSGARSARAEYVDASSQPVRPALRRSQSEEGRTRPSRHFWNGGPGSCRAAIVERPTLIGVGSRRRGSAALAPHVN